VLCELIQDPKRNGVLEIRVPDLRCVMKRVVTTGMDIEGVLDAGPSGPWRRGRATRIVTHSVISTPTEGDQK